MWAIKGFNDFGQISFVITLTTMPEHQIYDLFNYFCSIERGNKYNYSDVHLYQNSQLIISSDLY